MRPPDDENNAFSSAGSVYPAPRLIYGVSVRRGAGAAAGAAAAIRALRALRLRRRLGRRSASTTEPSRRRGQLRGRAALEVRLSAHLVDGTRAHRTVRFQLRPSPSHRDATLQSHSQLSALGGRTGALPSRTRGAAAPSCPSGRCERSTDVAAGGTVLLTHERYVLELQPSDVELDGGAAARLVVVARLGRAAHAPRVEAGVRRRALDRRWHPIALPSGLHVRAAAARGAAGVGRRRDDARLRHRSRCARKMYPVCMVFPSFLFLRETEVHVCVVLARSLKHTQKEHVDPPLSTMARAP